MQDFVEDFDRIIVSADGWYYVVPATCLRSSHRHFSYGYAMTKVTGDQTAQMGPVLISRFIFTEIPASGLHTDG